MWPDLESGWPFDRPPAQTLLGVAMGALVVLLAIATQTAGDGWRPSVYFSVSAVSGALLGWRRSPHLWTRAAGASLGQFVTACVWAFPLALENDGLVLIWPLFVVPAGLMLMVAMGLWGRPSRTRAWLAGRRANGRAASGRFSWLRAVLGIVVVGAVWLLFTMSFGWMIDWDVRLVAAFALAFACLVWDRTVGPPFKDPE